MDNGSMFGNLSYGIGETANTIGAGTASLIGQGSRISPFVFGRPQPTEIGHGGLYYQPTGFLQGAAYSMGIGHAPHHATPIEYGRAVVGDFAERLALGGATALGTAGGLALGANSILGVPMLGAPMGVMGSGLGGALGSMFGGAGMATGAKIGAFAGSWLAAPMAGLAISQGLMESVTDRLVNQSLLDAESFRFIGSGSPIASPRLGAGMSRRARQEATEFIRELDIESEFFGDEEFRQILQESMRKGLFTGTGDMENFKKRFKDITENVKEIMKLMNTTLDEGINVIAELRQYGIDPSRSREVAALADTTGRIAGRTASEMVTFGMQGAQQFVGTGITPEIGMQANMANLAAVRSARDAGMISQQALAHLGGETGAAQFLTQSSLSFMQTGFARGFAASFFDPTAGGLDTSKFIEEVSAGTAGDLMKRYNEVSDMFRDPIKLIQYQNQQERVLSEMGKTFGGQGLQLANMFAAGGLAEQLQSYIPGLSGPDAYKYVLKTTYGYSDPQADLVMDMINNRVQTFKDKQESDQKTGARKDSVLAEERSPTYRLYEKIKDWGAEWFDRLGGESMTRKINNAVETVTRFSEEVHGQVTVDMSGLDVQDLERYTTDLTKGRVIKRGEAIDVGRRFGGFVGMSETIGEELLKDIRAGRLGEDAKDWIKTMAPDRSRIKLPEVDVSWSEIQKTKDNFDMMIEQSGVEIQEAIDEGKKTGNFGKAVKMVSAALNVGAAWAGYMVNSVARVGVQATSNAVENISAPTVSGLSDWEVIKRNIEESGETTLILDQLQQNMGYVAPREGARAPVTSSGSAPDVFETMSMENFQEAVRRGEVLGVGRQTIQQLEEGGVLERVRFGGETAKDLLQEALFEGKIRGDENLAKISEIITRPVTQKVVGRFMERQDVRKATTKESLLERTRTDPSLAKYFGAEGLERAVDIVRRDKDVKTPEQARATLVRNLKINEATLTEERAAAIAKEVDEAGLTVLLGKDRELGTRIESLQKAVTGKSMQAAMEGIEERKGELEGIVLENIAGRTDELGKWVADKLGGKVEFKEGVMEAIAQTAYYQRSAETLETEAKIKEKEAETQSGDQQRSTLADAKRARNASATAAGYAKQYQMDVQRLQLKGASTKGEVAKQMGVVRAIKDVIFTPTDEEKSGVTDILTDVAGLSTALVEQRKEVAESAIGVGAISALRGKGYTKTEIKSMLDDIKGVTTVQGLREAGDLGELGNTPIGKMILQQKDQLATLEGLGVGEAAVPKVREQLEKMGVKGDQLGELTEKITSMDKSTREFGLQEAMEEGILGAFDREKFTTAVGGTKDIDKQTGKEFLISQAKVNQGVVMALEALAKRLNL